MKKKNNIIGILALTICFISAFSIFANAWHLVYPTSFNVMDGTHVGGSLSDVWIKNEGDTMDFTQAAYVLKVNFDVPNTRCRALYFKFTDTSAWDVVDLRIVYEEWWVPSQDIYRLRDGDHAIALWSVWKVAYVQVIIYWPLWGQTIHIDYLVLKSM